VKKFNQLIRKIVKLEDCVPYPGGYTGEKSQWRRNKSPMYPKIRLSLEKVGMINPLWVFLEEDGTYRIVKGSCRAVAWYDMGKKDVEVLIAPLGMDRKQANALFRNSDFIENIFMIDPKTGEFLSEKFPKGF